ncbi:hypothetical protein [Billgrantia endophytica]|uniref:Uncharacterized protein n=1 Tax=Billgrantia endophytica TaxID=2033802 RepID=A0A2N7TWW3_9GAMM|nr:hypothetical protein [Halomonas endophytica]PMR72666.1 hypothetical protein C1H69_20705 [Halomonas endophytica]
MEDSSALVLLPQEQLTLAHAHETGELHRYRQLALSFLPTASHVSSLMTTLGEECERRLQTLSAAAERLELVDCLPKQSPNMPPRFAKTRQHFFVIDHAMGEQMFEQALEGARESRLFLEWLLETTPTPELYEPLRAFAMEKGTEYHILLESQEQWRLDADSGATRPELWTSSPLVSGLSRCSEK